MKKLFKIVWKCLALLIVCALLGIALVAVSYSFPERTITFNASASTDFLVSSYVNKDTVWMDWPDYFTDVVMLNIASFYEEGSSVFHRAVANEKIGNTFDIVRWLSERTEIVKTYYAFDEGEALDEVTTYGKYWNGYLIFLRPLLLYFNMRQIYRIFLILLSVMFGLTALLLLIKDAKFVVPFVCGFLALRPFSKFCLTYAIIEILLCTFMCVLILNTKLRESDRKVRVCFFLMGVAANFFTLMNFSFAIALFCAVYTAYSVPRKQNEVMSREKLLVALLFWYAAGYCAMWAMKWLIILIFDPDILSEVAYSVALRLSHEDNGTKVTLYEALLWNLCGFYYKNKALLAGFVLIGLEAVTGVVLFISGRRNVRDTDTGVITVPVIIASATVIRYALVLNHSKIHYFFMNRLLSGLLFALLSAGAVLVFGQRSSD